MQGALGVETRQSLGESGGWYAKETPGGERGDLAPSRLPGLSCPRRSRRHPGDGQGRLGERGIAGDSLVKSERRHPLPPDRSSISPQNPAELVLAAPELMNMLGVI